MVRSTVASAVPLTINQIVKNVPILAWVFWMVVVVLILHFAPAGMDWKVALCWTLACVYIVLEQANDTRAARWARGAMWLQVAMTLYALVQFH